MSLRASPIKIELPASPMRADASIDEKQLYKAVHNLHMELTGNPATASAAATDLATSLTLLNQIRAALIAKGILV